tara:strand:+ start:852 stop:1547 length:696 start_codon:yes stop_codon:yes gene_type:complete
MKKKKYNIIATIKPWNIDFFKKKINKLSGNWILINKPSELTFAKLDKISIDNIYFVHWSKIIPSSIYKRYRCISFHMTDLPYGRGGSPLQNLILRKKKFTKISAFKVNNKIDGGPIYLKKKLILNGSAQEIFIRAAKIVLEMIKKINIARLNPKPQKPSKISFKRLTKKDNLIDLKKIKNLNELYDRIRMVDAPEYPDAYIESKNFVFNFNKVKKIKNILYSSVKITFIKN